MIQVADNFNYRGKKPNFDRDSFDTLQDMKNYSENSLDDGHISYCKETNKHYKFNSNNQSDPTTGKWVEQHEAVPADEEDITEQNGTIQLANKTYDKQSFSGLGRVYLRKNIVGDKNVLTQAMINKANTIYVIQYDYDLKEASINIPENCVLQFDGGSLSNGTIHGSLTKISNDSNAKIFDSISFTGTFSVIKIYANWFDNPEDDDISIAFRQAFELNKVNKLDNYSTITVLNGEYNCRGYILMGTSTILDFNGSIIHDLDIDTPLVTIPPFENQSGNEYSRCTIRNGRILSYGNRLKYYTIDLFNVWRLTCEYLIIAGRGEYTTKAKHGIGIGSKKEDYTASCFVNRVVHCQVPMIDIHEGATDSYIAFNEIWANNLDTALIIGASSQIIVNNQFVGGQGKGCIYIDENVNLLKIEGNYFDGSYDKLDTNYGIYATKQSGKNIITGNSFWHLKKEAIHIEGLFDSTIANNNFDDNDIYGRGLPDIYLGVSSYSNVIIGNTFNRQMIFDPSDNYVVKNRKDAGTLAPIFNISSTISNGTTLITGNTLINPQLYLPAVYTNNPNLIVSKGNNHSIFENKSSDPTLNYMQCGDIKATQNAPIIKNTLGEFNRLQIVKTSQQKKQSEALNHYTFDGTSVFDTDNIKPTWVYKETWYDSNGNPAYAEKTGTQYQRPANVKMGFYYFDTSLNKPIWKNSDTENVWIDATGATV